MANETQFSDDPTIRDECMLLRRIHPFQVVDDDNLSGGMRISSAAFKDPEMSVHIEDDLITEGHQINAVLERYPDMDLAGITAGSARNRKQVVCRDHLPDELCHGIIAGKKTPSIARHFAREATDNWLIQRHK